MEPDGSLRRLQENTTGFYHKPDESSSHYHTFFFIINPIPKSA